jgi:tetratricopeptide (TPR) repeat protein
MAISGDIDVSKTRATWIPWLVYAVLVVGVTALFFANVAGHGLDSHDAETFADNARISEDFSYFFSPERQQITGRPAADLSKWLASLVLGDSAAGFHLLVVGAHALAALLLARLVDVLYDNRLWAFTSGLLFLVNVTHFQAIHHISALDYPLALCWAIVALLFFLRYDETEKHSDLVLTYFFFALGALTHMAAAALGPLCLYWSWQRSGDLRAAVLRVTPLGIMLAALVFYSLAITPKATSAWAAIDHYEATEVSPLSPLRVLAWFSGRLLSTAHWVPFFSVYKQQPWEVYFGASVLTGWLAAGWYYKKIVVTWFFWIVLSLSPFIFIPEDLVLNFLPGGPSRYLYIASAGSSVLIALGLVRVGALVGKSKGIFLLLVTALVCVSSYAGLKRAEGLSHYTSARHYLASANAEEGIYRLRRAIDEGGRTIPLQDAYERLVLATMIEPDRASAIAEEGMALFADSVPMNLYRLILNSFNGDAAVRSDAESRLEVIATIPKTRGIIGLGYFNLANGLKHRGALDEALAAYKRSLDFLPDKANLLQAYSNALVLRGHFDQAVAVMERLIELDEVGFEMYYVLGRLYLMRGNTVGAQKALGQVVQLVPDSKEASTARALIEEL